MVPLAVFSVHPRPVQLETVPELPAMKWGFWEMPLSVRQTRGLGVHPERLKQVVFECSVTSMTSVFPSPNWSSLCSYFCSEDGVFHSPLPV